MPIVKEWPPILSKGRLAQLVTRAEDDARERSIYQDRLSKMAARAQERRVIHPALAFESFAISQRGGDWVRLNTGVTLRVGTLAVDCLAGAQRLLVAVGTLGPGLESEMNRLFADRRVSDALALEDISIAALHAFSGEIITYLAEVARRHSVHIGSPLGPGDENFPVEQQTQLCALTQADQIGVESSKTGVLSPAKSLSMVVGMGTRPAQWTTEARCDSCNIAHQCEFRQSTRKLV